jgi:hypothetical protein
MEEIRRRADARKLGSDAAPLLEALRSPQSGGERRVWLYNLGRLQHELAAANLLRNAVGTLNPRPRGLHNAAIQFTKRIMRRMLSWYTRPLQDFHQAVTLSLSETTRALENMRNNLIALSDDFNDSRKELDSIARLRADLQSVSERLDFLERRLPQDAATARRQE